MSDRPYGITFTSFKDLSADRIITLVNEHDVSRISIIYPDDFDYGTLSHEDMNTYREYVFKLAEFIALKYKEEGNSISINIITDILSSPIFTQESLMEKITPSDGQCVRHVCICCPCKHTCQMLSAETNARHTGDVAYSPVQYCLIQFINKEASLYLCKLLNVECGLSDIDYYDAFQIAVSRFSGMCHMDPPPYTHSCIKHLSDMGTCTGGDE